MNISSRIKMILAAYDAGDISISKMEAQIKDVFLADIDDVECLLSAITGEGEKMRFSVDGNAECSLRELAAVNVELTTEDMVILLCLRVGERTSFGLGADVKRVV